MKKIRKIAYGGAVTGLQEEQAIIRSIKKSRKTANWQQAEEGALFEKELSKYLGVKHAILTNSGSSAGLLALASLDLPKGSEVIISTVTFPTIFNIIIQCGLIPVVVDAKVGTYGFDVLEVERAITDKTRAIIAIHPVGNPVDMPELMKIVKHYNLNRKDKIYVLEDNCDGLGSSIGKRKVGAYGDISITSFHAAHIVSMGVGGGVFTNNEEVAKRVRMYRDWGRQANTNEPNRHESLPKDYNPRFIYEKIGYNFQILDLQAAMGRVQLRKIEKIKKARKKNFDYLYKHLSQMKYRDQDGEYTNAFTMPRTISNADVCWFAFPLTYWGDRGALTKHLEKNGIETRSMFSGDITKHPAYEGVEYRIGPDGLEEAQLILRHSFWVSCHPRLTNDDLKYMIEVFDNFFDKNR